MTEMQNNINTNANIGSENKRRETEDNDIETARFNKEDIF